MNVDATNIPRKRGKTRQYNSLKYQMENRKLKKKIKILEQRSSKMNLCSSSKAKLFFFIVTVSIFVFLYYELDDMRFEKEKARFYEISKQLHTDVFHQHDAVEVILRHLSRIKNNQWQSYMFVMPFVGTSGVSKTYVANIIRQNYYSTYVHDVSKYDLGRNFEQTYFNTLKKLQSCCNLVIIDDLTSNDIDITVRFITALPKRKVTLVIPIINEQIVNVVNNELFFSSDNKCVENVESKFTLSKLYFEVILFHVISKHELETAIIQLMVQKSVDYNKCGHLVKEIVDNHDIVTHGYKHLHHKLNVIWQCDLDHLECEHQCVYNDNKDIL